MKGIFQAKRASRLFVPQHPKRFEFRAISRRVFSILLFFPAFSGLVSAQQNGILEMRFTQCEPSKDSLFIYSFNGFYFEREVAAPIEGDTVVLNLPWPGPRFAYVGIGSNNVKPFVLGLDDRILLEGDCARMRHARFLGKESANLRYERLKAELNRLRAAHSKAVQDFNRMQRDSAGRVKVLQRMALLDEQKLSLLDRMEKEEPYFAEVVRLNTYLSYPVQGKGYADERPYFAKEYFQFVDWSKEELDYMPWVYEAWKAYGETMCSLGFSEEEHRALILEQLNSIPSGTRRKQLAYGGLLSALQRRQHASYLFFAKAFTEEYAEISPRAVAQLQQQISRLSASMPGAQAPDFEGLTPEGDTLRLSDFRGKVVLIDFWASWCGPCRRENPNVVRAYEKYKDKGFEIIGVSLDRDRKRWLAAIEADGLGWHHVSDLRGWQNAIAGLYGVRSIPHAVLLDREGRIVAVRLRGAQLEQQLERLLGK